MDYEKKKIEKLEHEVIDYERGIGYSVSLDDVINKLNEVIGVLNGEPELSESEDERIRKCVTEIVKCFAWRDGFEPVTKEKCLAWLEKQKEQKPVEWSEEDEKNIYFLTRLIELYIKDGRYETGDGTVTKPEIIKMLKSLRPQKKEDLPRWKKWYNGACGNCNNIPIALVKVGCSYALTDCLGITGQEYIMLSDLEKLPKEDGK